MKELETARRNKAILGVERQATLKEYAAHHLRQKKRAGKVSDGYLTDTQKHLERAVSFFGADRDLMSINVRDVENWCAALRRLPGGGKTTLSPQTIRHHLNALSNLYRRAASENTVPPGYNPVGAMMEKPSGRAREADWLEVHDAALLLEAARRYTPPSGGHLRPPPGSPRRRSLGSRRSSGSCHPGFECRCGGTSWTVPWQQLLGSRDPVSLLGTLLPLPAHGKRKTLARL